MVWVGGGGCGGLDMMDVKWSPHLTCAGAVTTFWLVSPTPSLGSSWPSWGAAWESSWAAGDSWWHAPCFLSQLQLAPPPPALYHVPCLVKYNSGCWLVGWAEWLQLMVHKVKCFNGNCCSFISRNSSFHFLVLKASFNISRYVLLFTRLLSNYLVPRGERNNRITFLKFNCWI